VVDGALPDPQDVARAWPASLPPERSGVRIAAQYSTR
jgi:hypothetical protein